MLARRTRKLCGVSRLYILYAEYSSRTYCWNSGLLRQWVMSLRLFCPTNKDVGGGGALKRTLSGGKSHTSLARRVMPRGLSVMGSAWPDGSVSVAAATLSIFRLCAKRVIGPVMTMWIGSDDANRGFGCCADACADSPTRPAAAAINAFVIARSS